MRFIINVRKWIITLTLTLGSRLWEIQCDVAFSRVQSKFMFICWQIISSISIIHCYRTFKLHPCFIPYYLQTSLYYSFFFFLFLGRKEALIKTKQLTSKLSKNNTSARGFKKITKSWGSRAPLLASVSAYLFASW